MNDTEEKEAQILTPEIDPFPYSNEVELQKLREILKGRNVEIILLGQAGYIIHNPQREIIAEAPWILLDFDDTAARTTADKKECWQQLEEMGIPQEVIKYCDKISRIDFSRTGFLYQPQLEMRLITLALNYFRTGKKDIGELKKILTKARNVLVLQKKLGEYGIDPTVNSIYQQTRYTSTLYEDTIATITSLRGETERPNNIAILTYGDPIFQLTKVVRTGLLEHINQIWLTRVRKGDYFQTLLSVNPFKNLSLKYTYKETPRNIGIDFKNWQIMVVLFDDDPKQVKSFNRIAQEEGIAGLGVIRVRRRGTKRFAQEIQLTRLTGEIHPSDTYLDSYLYELALIKLEARILENFLLTQLQKHGYHALTDPRAFSLIQVIATRQGTTYEEVKNRLLKRAGINRLGGFSDETSGTKVEIWSK